MRTGTRWTTRKGLVWGLGVVLAVLGSVAVSAAAPTGGTERAATFPVDVIGPGFAQPGNECLFRAVPQGGTPPYVAYHWDYPASGSNEWAHATMPQGSSLVAIRATVLDSEGHHGAGILWVNVNSSNDPCGI